MKISNQNSKIIFGLKVKQLRQKKGLPFKELSEKTGMSVSYLNEIEKGKKFPKPDKVQILAEVLETSYEELISTELRGGLAPVGELLQSNFLNELPLDLFGIELSKVIEIIANSPLKVGAFISTLVELSRSFELREENFYFHAVRAYQELHYNYFEDIEQSVDTFIKKYKVPVNKPVSVRFLKSLLSKYYDYEIIENGLDAYPELKTLRSVYIPKQKRLLLNGQLNDKQKALQLGKELAYNFLKLKDRINTSSFLSAGNFQTVLNNYIAGYFAVAILVNRASFVEDLKIFFEQPRWEPEYFRKLLEKYEVSPEVLFQRFNVLPTIFGIPKLFFVRVIHDPKKNQFELDKELHLNRKHHPHANGLEEHYCRRWLSIRQLRELSTNKKNSETPVLGIQRSKYSGTNDEYLCFTMARSAYFPSTRNVSVTIGLLVGDELESKIRFLPDPAIPKREVGVTCERCAIQNCKERVAPPVIIQRRGNRKKMQVALNKLMG